MYAGATEALLRQTNGRRANILISTMPSSTAGTSAPVIEATVASSAWATLSGSGLRLSVPMQARSAPSARLASSSPSRSRSAMPRSESSLSVHATAMAEARAASALSVMRISAGTERPATHQRTDFRHRGCGLRRTGNPGIQCNSRLPTASSLSEISPRSAPPSTALPGWVPFARHGWT